MPRSASEIALDGRAVVEAAERVLKETGPSASRNGECYEGCGDMGACHSNIDRDARALALLATGLDECTHDDMDHTEFSDGTVRRQCRSCYYVRLEKDGGGR